MPNSNILCVGLCCFDVVSEVTTYPKEDSDKRCVSQVKQRGGNASNNATVLGLLGEEPHFFGVLADSIELRFLKEDFNKFGVNASMAVVREGYESPYSYIILSNDTGSRTIIHYNANIPEVTLEQFEAIDLRQLSWIHFEGRNIEEVPKMVKHIREFSYKNNLQITISIEIEKIQENLETLIPLADILFVSKDFARSMNWHTMEDAVSGLFAKFTPIGTTICAWGEMGAAAKLNKSAPVCVSKSFPPSKIVNTCCAGDTFIAGTIGALNNGQNLENAIEFGCKLAGAKIGHKGWNLQLKDVFRNIANS